MVEQQDESDVLLAAFGTFNYEDSIVGSANFEVDSKNSESKESAEKWNCKTKLASKIKHK